jgi:phosphotransferase system enzyme I (PtsI)
MIETPAAAMQLSNWINEVDFVSIGSNDLLHTLLGIERNDDELVHLKNPLDPAFLATVARIVQVADDAGKPVTICGDASGNRLASLAFHALGVTTLSVSVDQVHTIRQTFTAASHVLTAERLSLVKSELLRAETTADVMQILKNRLDLA